MSRKRLQISETYAPAGLERGDLFRIKGRRTAYAFRAYCVNRTGGEWVECYSDREGLRCLWVGSKPLKTPVGPVQPYKLRKLTAAEARKLEGKVKKERSKA